MDLLSPHSHPRLQHRQLRPCGIGLNNLARPYSHGRRLSGLPVRVRGGLRIRSFLNPIDEPLVKEALKEPVAFLGGVFAGLLRLDLQEDPLKEWIARTAEAAGINEDQGQDQETQSQVNDEAPQQIEIE
ncbi:hypothetical protein SUGI_0087830 [Cryptomeria japonica]|uniref:UPF0426 protein At1g28150, chloroplastic n=1 Tax=Cryptomeria japonica TaxID=3369 RepID=UPI002408B23D|nr:UPF0426 protein At1g28150, chloroplastic [Cryptomeria japonica]GLJ08387.1 hypothetical protein SUGI_0087830 [Cryptomeria japonica]